MQKNKKVERKQEQIQEIIKCGKDPAYFIKTYVKISHPVKGPIPFETFPYQDECIEMFQQHRLLICNKSRQLGLSTVSAAYCLWMALFHREKNILVIATKLETAKLFLTKVKGMFDYLPGWLVMPSLTGESVKYLTFSNGSRIKAIPTSPDAGRGEAISLCVVDEAAHIDGFDELWTGLSPMASTGGSFLLISSPKGIGNQFHNIWVKATDNGFMPETIKENQEGSNGFYGIELPWTVHPEHDESWYKQQCDALLNNPRAIAQELLCAFNGSGNTFIDSKRIEELKQEVRTPIDRIGTDYNLYVWKYESPGHQYIIGADVARGDAEDYSTFYVFDYNEQEAVAEFKGKIPPDKFAKLLVETAERYNEAFIVSEQNGPGYGCSIALKALNYPNVYYEKLFNGNLKPQYFEYEIEDMLPGFQTNVKTRNEIMTKFDTAIRNKVLKIYSNRFIKELETFVWDGKKAKALKGCHDDLILSCALGCFFLDCTSKATIDDTEMINAMIGSMSSTKRTLNDITPKNPMFDEMPSRGGWGGSPHQPGRRPGWQNPMRRFDWLK